VADEAGQSLRTLYQYFASKEDLLLAVFEEAMITYATLIRAAIEEMTNPLERVAGAMLAAMHMPDVSPPGVQRGLARLRLRLGEVEPELIGRAQAAVTTLMADVVQGAADDGSISVPDVESVTFVVLALNTSFITSEALGNDAGVRRPDLVDVARFCLQGMGATASDEWLRDVESRLRLPTASPRRARTNRKKPAAR
jgi:AcrR family transcriptional regulator